jgi:hypothetical protein
METLISDVLMLANASLDLANVNFSSLLEGNLSLPFDGGLIIASVLGGTTGGPSDGVRSKIKQWHGTINEQFANINSLADIILAHQPQWTIATPRLRHLTDNRDKLQLIINKCNSSSASLDDREERDALLKSTVKFCLVDMKIWAYDLYADGIVTLEEVHKMGFLVPGERGGKREKSEESLALAVVKAVVVGTNTARITLDHSVGKNAGQVKSGWPTGVRNAVIIITADDGKTEIVHKTTSKLHNNFKMPDDAHGKTFFVKASFLKHLDDEPNFGDETMFTMPKTLADYAKG